MANLSLSFFSLFWGREIVNSNQSITHLYTNPTLTMETIKKTIQLNESFLIFFGIFVIYRYAMMIAGMSKLFSNVKSVFDHVTRRYDIASLGAKSERQDRQAD